MTQESVFEIIELHDYVLHTSDKTWGETTNRMPDRKVTFIFWLSRYRKGKFITTKELVESLQIEFPNKQPIDDPNGRANFQRPKWEWAWVNIQSNVTCYTNM